MRSEIAFRDDIGLWWPRYDLRYELNAGFLRNRIQDIDIIAGYCQQRRVVVQAGGHVGLWPKRLAELFVEVITFEAHPGNYAALRKNITASNVRAYAAALSSTNGLAQLAETGNPATEKLHERGLVQVETRTIDSLNLSACDAIMLDIEGHEGEALKGAAATIKRCRPIIQIEMLPRLAAELEQTMILLGYGLHTHVRSDAIFFPH